MHRYEWYILFYRYKVMTQVRNKGSVSYLNILFVITQKNSTAHSSMSWFSKARKYLFLVPQHGKIPVHVCQTSLQNVRNACSFDILTFFWFFLDPYSYSCLRVSPRADFFILPPTSLCLLLWVCMSIFFILSLPLSSLICSVSFFRIVPTTTSIPLLLSFLLSLYIFLSHYIRLFFSPFLCTSISLSLSSFRFPSSKNK